MRRKIYHVHIRKTGGRSVHHAIFGLTGKDTNEIYRRLVQNAGKAVTFDTYRFAGWCLNLSQEFDYAFSHQPFYKLQKPTTELYLVCCVRNPVQRFISHWKMLKHYVETREQQASLHPGLEPEIGYFDDDILKFFEKLPPFHVFNQLFMFSPSGDLDDATNAMSHIDLILETEDLRAGMPHLFKVWGESSNTIPHIGASEISPVTSPDVMRKLHELFSPEYELIARARAMKGHYSAQIL